MKRITKEQKKIMEKWIKNNGACSFDYKNGDIILHDGGLFSIEKKKVRLRKIVGYKKLPDGYTQIIFSKKRLLKDEAYHATIWMEELQETINYLNRMKKMLNKVGIKTQLRKQKLEIMDKILSKSKLTEQGALELGREINKGVAKRHGLIK